MFSRPIQMPPRSAGLSAAFGPETHGAPPLCAGPQAQGSSKVHQAPGLWFCRKMALKEPHGHSTSPHGPCWAPRHICTGQALSPGQPPTSPRHLHCVQVLALEGYIRLVVHGDDQWAGVQELGAVVLLERRKLVKGPVATAKQRSSRPLCAVCTTLTMWAGTMPSSGLGEASRHSWYRRSHWQVQRLLAQEMHLGERAVRSVGPAEGAGRGSHRASGEGAGPRCTRPERHSRQVLRQAHGLPAVVEGVQVGGEEDAAASEEQLDVHSHVVCGRGQDSVGRGPQCAG